MTIENKEVITLIGILVSLTIGLTSIYIGVRNSKKTIFINSVTSSRTKWIDTIRNTIAEYCGLATQIPLAPVEEKIKKHDKLQQLKYLIKLQLNRSDPFDAIMIGIIDSIAIHVYDKYPSDLNKEIDKLINLTQDLLKLEWEGVKEETKKGNLSKREKTKLYNRYLRKYQNGEENI